MNDFSEQTIHNLACMPNTKVGFIIDDKSRFFRYKCALNTLQLQAQDLFVNDNEHFYEVINKTTNTVLVLCSSKARARASRSNLIFTDESISEDDYNWAQQADVQYQLI